MRVLVASLVVLAGCDSLFDLELVQAPPPMGERPAFCEDAHLFENFDDGELAGCGLAFPFGTVRREDGELVLDVASVGDRNSGCTVTAPERPFTANGIFLRVTRRLEVEDTYTVLKVRAGDDEVSMVYNGTLQLFIQFAPLEKLGDLADPPEWWRLRRVGDDIIAETSETGAWWNELARKTMPGRLETVAVDFMAGIGPNGSADTARFSAFGICR